MIFSGEREERVGDVSFVEYKIFLPMQLTQQVSNYNGKESNFAILGDGIRTFKEKFVKGGCIYHFDQLI